MLCSRRCSEAVSSMASGPWADSLPWFDSPLVQGARRLRYTDKAQTQRPGDMPQMALAQKRRSAMLCNYRRRFWKQETSYRSPRWHDIVTSLCKRTMKRRKKLKARASDVLLVRREHGPKPPLHFLRLLQCLMRVRPSFHVGSWTKYLETCSTCLTLGP